MKKIEVLRKLQTYGIDVSFTANVILTQQTNPVRRLNGLLTLIENGHNVMINAEGRLVVNGELRAWVELEMKPEVILTTTAVVA